jgi:hypothetical protein
MRALIVIFMLISLLATSMFAAYAIRTRAGPVYTSSSARWFRTAPVTLQELEHWLATSLNGSRLIRWANGELGALRPTDHGLGPDPVATEPSRTKTAGSMPTEAILLTS